MALGHACRPQRGLTTASGLSTCSMDTPKVLSKLVGRLSPSFCPVATLTPHTSASALLALPMSCSQGNCCIPSPTTPSGHEVTGFPDTMLQMFPLRLVKPAAVTTAGTQGMWTCEQEHPNSISYASKILIDAGDSSPTSCIHQTGEPTHVFFITISREEEASAMCLQFPGKTKLPKTSLKHFT